MGMYTCNSPRNYEVNFPKRFSIATAWILMEIMTRGVNLAQSTGFGPDPCGLEPKKPTLKKSPQQRSPQGQKPYKRPQRARQPVWT